MESNAQHSPARGFSENLEQVRFWERSLFGEEFLRIAMQAGHRDSARFYAEMSSALERCETLEDATRLGKHIKLSVPSFCDRAKGCPTWLNRQMRLAEVAEAKMLGEKRGREMKGMPSFFDRRTEKWVRKDQWHPVPFVDDALM